jgi:hypothetical protein
MQGQTLLTGAAHAMMAQQTVLHVHIKPDHTLTLVGLPVGASSHPQECWPGEICRQGRVCVLLTGAGGPRGRGSLPCVLTADQDRYRQPER